MINRHGDCDPLEEPEDPIVGIIDEVMERMIDIRRSDLKGTRNLMIEIVATCLTIIRGSDIAQARADESAGEDKST